MRKGTQGRHTTPPTKPRQSGVPFYHPPVLKHSSGTTRRRQYQGHYTVAPCCGHNKTAPAAVLHGSMFSKPMCGSASAHKVRAAAQAAALRLLYHGAAKRPRQNRIHCGFAWFNVLKSMRESASAHEERAAAQAADLRLLYHISGCMLCFLFIFVRKQQPYAVVGAAAAGRGK